MRKFLKSVLLFSSPFVFILGVYISLDPFKVIRSYESFIDMKAKGWVGINKDYISTTTFDNNYKIEKYNSFIFGNSRSIFYQISDWKNHIPQNSNCYHFDASGESLFSLHKKIQYIDSKNLEIKNVLLILDFETLIQEKSKSGHLTIISPQLVNYSNIINFHFTFFKTFLNPNFFYAFIDFKISGKVKPYMKNEFLLDDRPLNYNYRTNEMRFDYFEELISQNKYFSSNRLAVFYERKNIQIYSPISIRENQIDILNDIHVIFKKHNTNCKIVISPLYNQKKLHIEDLGFLKNLFGANNVFNYSGINIITKDYRNYYENSHYRPHVASDIMKEIYK